MVDWYFEMLGVTLTLDDHHSIKRNADRYIDEITGLSSPGARKQLLQHRSVDIDGVVFSTRLTPRCAGPITRLRSKRSKYIIPWATTLSDAEGTPSRLGPIESGGD